MAKYNGFFKRIDWYVVFLIFLAILTHIAWFNPKSLLFFLDWKYLPDSTVGEFFLNLSRTIWIHSYGLGSANIQNYMFPFFYIWGVIGSYSLGMNLIFLWPIAILSVLSPYYLLKYLKFEKSVCFLGSLMFAFNTYLIMRTNAHLTIAMVNVLTPLIILFFFKIKDDFNLKNSSIFMFLFTLGIIYELRIMLIVSFILFIVGLFIFCGNLNRGLIKRGIMLILLFLLLNSFWILPTAFSDKTQITSVIDRNLWGQNLFDLLHALALSEYHWSSGEYIQEFIKTPIKIYLWLVPIISFLGLLFIKNEKDLKRKRILIAFSLVLLIGLLLSKFVSPPFHNLYSFLFNNLLGFSIFREPSKFYLIVSIAYLILFSYSLQHMSKFLKKSYINTTLFLIIFLLLLINSIPLFTKNIGGLYVSQNEPSEYKLLSEKMINDSDYHFRTIWVPFYHQLGYFSIYRPKISLWDELNDPKSIIYNTTQIKPGISNFKNVKLYSNIFLSDNGRRILNNLNVKYIIVPMQLPESLEKIFPYAGDRKEYVKEFDKISYLKKIDFGNLTIYENQNYKPLILISENPNLLSDDSAYLNINFEIKNPSKYLLKIGNLSETTYLHFMESYNPGWQIIFLKSYAPFYNNDILDETHYKNDMLFNSWTIDPQYIKDNYSEKYYTENPDGSINVEMVLYFKPQSYFYLGLLISGVTLLGCVGYLVWDWLTKRRNKRF